MILFFQIFGAVAAPMTGLAAAIWRMSIKVSQTNQHFDPDSPVGIAIGTIPERIKRLEEHLSDVTIWKPGVDDQFNKHGVRIETLETRAQ
jgi:hypothetical protein